MPELRTKEAMLAAVRAEQERLETLLSRVPRARLEEPLLPGGWSAKDLLAHLTGWRLRTMARLEAARDGTIPASSWPTELEQGDEEAIVQAVNDWLLRTSRERPLDEVIDEARETLRRIEAAIVALPEERLLAADYPWWGYDIPLGPGVIGGMVEHASEEHAEHFAALERLA